MRLLPLPPLPSTRRVPVLAAAGQRRRGRGFRGPIPSRLARPAAARSRLMPFPPAPPWPGRLVRFLPIFFVAPLVLPVFPLAGKKRKRKCPGGHRRTPRRRAPASIPAGAGTPPASCHWPDPIPLLSPTHPPARPLPHLCGAAGRGRGGEGGDSSFLWCFYALFPCPPAPPRACAVPRRAPSAPGGRAARERGESAGPVSPYVWGVFDRPPYTPPYSVPPSPCRPCPAGSPHLASCAPCDAWGCAGLGDVCVDSFRAAGLMPRCSPRRGPLCCRRPGRHAASPARRTPFPSFTVHISALWNTRDVATDLTTTAVTKVVHRKVV